MRVSARRGLRPLHPLPNYLLARKAHVICEEAVSAELCQEPWH